MFRIVGILRIFLNGAQGSLATTIVLMTLEVTPATQSASATPIQMALVLQVAVTDDSEVYKRMKEPRHQ